jgi:hypothetical protein
VIEWRLANMEAIRRRPWWSWIVLPAFFIAVGAAGLKIFHDVAPLIVGVVTWATLWSALLWERKRFLKTMGRNGWLSTDV